MLVALDTLRTRHDRDELWETPQPGQPERMEAIVEAGGGDHARAHPAADDAGGVDLCLALDQRQVDPERHVDRADNDADPATRPRHPHDLRQHQIGVALLEHR